MYDDLILTADLDKGWTPYALLPQKKIGMSISCDGCGVNRKRVAGAKEKVVLYGSRLKQRPGFKNGVTGLSILCQKCLRQLHPSATLPVGNLKK